MPSEQEFISTRRRRNRRTNPGESTRALDLPEEDSDDHPSLDSQLLTEDDTCFYSCHSEDRRKSTSPILPELKIPELPEQVMIRCKVANSNVM